MVACNVQRVFAVEEKIRSLMLIEGSVGEAMDRRGRWPCGGVAVRSDGVGIEAEPVWSWRSLSHEHF